jgi:hypothetical protein
MRVEELARLGSELMAKTARVRELQDTARREQRDLSRRETAELTTIRREAEEIRAKLPSFDPRQAQGTARGGEVSEQPDRLKPEERVVDWLAERGQLPVRGFDNPERLSFGAMGAAR